MFIKFTSLIIPTKNRSDLLLRLFSSINYCISDFNEIIIVDSSTENENKKINNILRNYKNIKIIKSQPSTSIQRNIGINKFNKLNKFLMFCDDDIIFDKKAIENMNEFINDNSDNIGFGFNLLENKSNKFFEKLKKSEILTKIGLYHSNPGVVCANGWHTKLINLEKNCNTMWLSTQACIYQTKYLDKMLFDETLGKYSYLEDLFFSYKLSKRGKLSSCCFSNYFHPDNIQRSNFKFGVKEVTNRYKFVKSNNLSLVKFYITILLKIFFNFSEIFLLKFKVIPKILGNLVGLILCITK